MATRLRSWSIASATALAILGASIAPFLTPAYVRAEQDRVATGALTGFAPAQLDAVTGALLGDLVLWRGDFDVVVEGSPVLSERERAHMRDVRGVFTGFGLLVAAAIAWLVAVSRRSRGDTEAGFAAWRAVAGGARGLVAGLGVVGVFAVFAFEAAFEIFHRLFFSSGSYTFDPRTERLVQLFPQQFWSETAMAVGALALAVAVITAWLAARRAGAGDPVARLAPTRARP